MDTIEYTGFVRLGHKPKTDAEALHNCQACRHLDKRTQTCNILGQITVSSRDLCYRNGYADMCFTTHYGKVPAAPPCE